VWRSGVGFGGLVDIMDTFEKKRTLRHEMPEMSGVLLKEGRAFRRKKEVYCKLAGSVLYFFPPEETDQDDMEYRISEKEVQVNKCVRGSRPMELMVQDADFHSFSLFATNSEEYAEWYSALVSASKQRLESFYELGQVLGKGSYGIVRLARDRSTGEHFAVKILDKTRMKESDFRLLKREMLIVHHLKHDNVVGTYDIFDTSNRLYIVLELMPGGMLYDVIAQQGIFRERDAAIVMRDVFEALAYLHSHNIMHRDMKPENLLCKSSEAPFTVKLADFGFAKFIDCIEEYTLGSAVGTPYYVAPEVVKKAPYNTYCDMWSAGVILYNLLSGKQPFAGTKKAEVLGKIKAGDYSFPDSEWKGISSDAKSIIRGLLQIDPGKRLSASGALHHPWIQNQIDTEDDTDQEDLVRKMTQLSSSREHNVRIKRAVAAVVSANRLASAIQSDDTEKGHDTAAAITLASRDPKPAHRTMDRAFSVTSNPDESSISKSPPMKKLSGGRDFAGATQSALPALPTAKGRFGSKIGFFNKR